MTRLGALAHPPFARLLSGQLVSSAGTQMSITAGAWVLYRLTHSPLALGLQGLCFSAPIAVLPLLTGVLADRFSRLTLVKATLAAEAGQAFVLAAITTAGDLRPWMLYLAAAADACRLAVNIPAQSALVPNVVPAALLPSAMALSASVWSSAALAGPALAGALLTVTGPGPIFAINGACTLVALAALASLPGAEPGRRLSHGTGLAQLTGGIAYLRGHRPIVWLEGILLIAMTGAFAGAGAGLAAFAAGPPFALALFLLAGASLCLVITQVIAGTMVQQAIPDALRGRISALGSAGQNGLAGLAAAATAGLAAAVGPGRAVTGLAVAVASAGLLLTLLIARAGRRPAAPRRRGTLDGPAHRWLGSALRRADAGPG
jgi:hypothetical protein